MREQEGGEEGVRGRPIVDGEMDDGETLHIAGKLGGARGQLLLKYYTILPKYYTILPKYY